MSGLQLIRALYEYNESANGRVLEAASGLSEAEFGRDMGAGFGNVGATLGHIAGAQMVWLTRWTTGSYPPAEELEPLRGMPEPAAVGEAFARTHEGLRRFVSALGEGDLERVATYTDTRGTARGRPLWQLMAHVANHGTQHRSEAAMLLTALGRSPGDLDYVDFIEGRKTGGSLELIRRLYEYNESANRRLLEAASGLAEEELTREMGASFGSAAGSLRHILQAQLWWWSFWTDSERVRLPEPPAGRAMEAIREWFEDSHGKLREFVGSLKGDEDLDRVLVHRDEGRGRLEFALGDLMLHGVTHGTQHRSEAAMVLTALGRSPGDLDYVYFEYGRG